MALVCSFMKNWRWPLRLYPLAKVGARRMHSSASWCTQAPVSGWQVAVECSQRAMSCPCGQLACLLESPLTRLHRTGTVPADIEALAQQ